MTPDAGPECIRAARWLRGPVRREGETIFEPKGTRTYSFAAQRGWTNQGLIATLEPLLSEARCKRLRAVVEGRLDSVTIVMDAPHDPHNGAAILRTCDALGVQRVHVVPREEKFLASRVVTKGSEQWVDVINHPSPQVAIALLRARGFTLVGSHPQGKLLPTELASIPRLALVLGNEHDGIRAELARAIDTTVRIPMRGFVESLNVSVSAAVLLERATENRPGDIAEHERPNLYARWLIESVPRADEILAALPSR
jgi:tRNA (guanosine-2'-O-)-methyltransferase